MVDSDEKLAERVAFIHERIGTAAIAEQYIEGREIYVGVIGNERLRVLPVWELEFGNLAPGARAIATEKVKHDPELPEARRDRGRPGQGPCAGGLRAASSERRSGSTARSISTAMRASTSASRPTASPYFIEANPNPEIAKSEEFATAALHDGLAYPNLLQRIVALGISRAKAGMFVS